MVLIMSFLTLSRLSKQKIQIAQVKTEKPQEKSNWKRKEESGCQLLVFEEAPN